MALLRVGKTVRKAEPVAAVSLKYSTEAHRLELTDCGLDSFEQLWEVDADEVEAPNVRRGGWSSVARLETAAGAELYLKRQHNHGFRDRENGFRKTPTVCREWRMMARFASLGIGTAEALCTGVLQQDGNVRGILLTRALSGFRDLPAVLQRLPPLSEARRQLWSALADSLIILHRHKLRHNCLYGNHIMLREDSSTEKGWDIRLLDLEKVSTASSTRRAMISDLSQLERHTDDLSYRDRQWFWDRYFADIPLQRRRRLLSRLTRRTAERTVHQYISERLSQIR